MANPVVHIDSHVYTRRGFHTLQLHYTGKLSYGDTLPPPPRLHHHGAPSAGYCSVSAGPAGSNSDTVTPSALRTTAILPCDS